MIAPSVDKYGIIRDGLVRVINYWDEGKPVTSDYHFDWMKSDRSKAYLGSVTFILVGKDVNGDLYMSV